MCGPTTGFLWSQEEREEPIEPCIGKFCTKSRQINYHLNRFIYNFYNYIHFHKDKETDTTEFFANL